MWDKIKGYALAVLGVLGWVLTAWIFKLKEKNNELENQVNTEKAKAGSAVEQAKADLSSDEAKAADLAFDEALAEYNRNHPSDGESGTSH